MLFLERDVLWYTSHRTLPEPAFCRTGLYSSTGDLKERFAGDVEDADCVMLGSYVPERITVGRWVLGAAGGVRAFYDIDIPVTLASLEADSCDYLSCKDIPKFDVYLSFTGGPTLAHLEKRHGARKARALYCSADPDLYYPETCERKWILGYLGTYSSDRQPLLDRYVMQPARELILERFVVAGSQYPSGIEWPPNVERIEHLSPDQHRRFYNSQKFTLNVTRADMVRAGYSPSVRLFEAAACGTPILSDDWAGIESVFVPGKEILVVRSPEDARRYLKEMPEEERLLLGKCARERVLSSHTAAHRARELENAIREARGGAG